MLDDGEFGVSSIVLTWAVIPMIAVWRLELDSTQSIADWVGSAPNKDGRVMGGSCNGVSPDIENPTEVSHLLLIVVEISPSIACAMKGRIDDGPTSGVRISPTIQSFPVKHRDKVCIIPRISS